METKVTLFELLVSCGGAIVAIISAWVHMRISVGSLKTEMEYVKKQLEEEKAGNAENNTKLNDKIDKIFSMLSEIKVSIAEKK
jgi:hypothetical protein